MFVGDVLKDLEVMLFVVLVDAMCFSCFNIALDARIVWVYVLCFWTRFGTKLL